MDRPGVPSAGRAAPRIRGAVATALLALGVAAPLRQAVPAPVPLTVDDLYRQDTASELTLAPDGTLAVYVRVWAERGAASLRHALWMAEAPADAAGAPATRPLEAGQPDARRPVFTPDGKRVAFLSTRPFPDGTPACRPVPAWSEPASDIWFLPLGGGPAVPLGGPGKPYGRVFGDGFYGRLAFSPDGRRLAFVADDGVDPRTPEERAAGVTVVREDQGEGYEGYGPAAIWVADLAAEPGDRAATAVRRLTTDGFWYGDPQWTPDGTALIVHANRTGENESVRFSINQDHELWRIDVATGRLERLTTGPGPQVSPRVAPDGRRLVCLSGPRRGPHADVFNLEIVDLPAADGSRALGTRILRDVHSAAELSPLGVPVFPLPAECWLDERRFVVDTVSGMKSGPRIVDADSAAGHAEADGPEAPESFRQREARRRRLKPAGNAFLRDRIVAVDEIVRWRSFDGLEVEGVLTRPPAEVAKAPYALVVVPHGGPHSLSRPGFSFTVQLLAAHGYAVLQPNYRGTWGYGRGFLDANHRDPGGGEARDILTGIEQLVRDGVVDPRRQFVHGISYGGYLSCWLVGQTDQFRAAAPLNAVTDMNVMWGVGDIQSWTEWELGGRPWEVPELMRERSPFSHVHRVRTPTLILHSDHDRRCPLPMAQMFHRGLLEVGVETELVIYHDEGHKLHQLPHLEDMHRRMLAWFARHDLPEADRAAPAAGNREPGRNARQPSPEEIVVQAQDVVEVRVDQPYAGNDSPRQMVDVYLPRTRADDGPLPVVAMIHGGAWSGGDRRQFIHGAIALARTGSYAAVAVGYRLSDEAPWPAQIHDCKAAIRWIRGHAAELGLDPDRIGVMGSSAGGHLALMLGTSGGVATLEGAVGDCTDRSSRVTCVVNSCGPSDLRMPLFVGERSHAPDPAVVGLLGGDPADLPDRAREDSPVTYVTADDPAVLTLHGTRDERVDFRHAEIIDAALEQAGAASYLVPVVGAGHAIPRSPELLARVANFWSRYLRDAPTEISTAPIEMPAAP